MKAIIKSLSLGLLLVGVAACNQTPTTDQNSKSKSINNLKKETTENPTRVTSPFKEGVIQVEITTPGSAIGQLFQQVDPIKGNASAQLKELSKKLSTKDRMIIDEQSKKAGLMNLAMIMLPIRSLIYLKGNEATAKFDALTYHGENAINNAKKEGMMYLKSQNSNKEITVNYTGDSFNEMATNELKSTDYTIIKTNETNEIAGYPCSKSIYTLKNASKDKPIATAFPNTAGIYKIEVWTSAQMPKVVNFLHPLYIQENAGIMKLLIQYEKESHLKINYEFTKVENRPVTAAEMTIKKTNKIYDYGKDKITVGLQMMGVIFGM